MNTFLPHPDFNVSARCLDRARLGKQRVEALQILNVLTGQSRGWRHHPAVLMWQGYTDALMEYHNACLLEWIRRGYRNTMPFLHGDSVVSMHPPWLGNEAFHSAHRSNLLRKDPSWYGQFGWIESPDLPYVWPVKKAG